MKAYEADGSIVLVIEEKDWSPGSTIEVGGHKLVMDPPEVVEDEGKLPLDEEHEIPFVFNPAADMGIKILAEAEGTGDPAAYLRATRPLLVETIKEDPKDLLAGDGLADTQPSLQPIAEGDDL